MRGEATNRRTDLTAVPAMLALLPTPQTGSLRLMTDKQAVIDARQRLPENASLEEIAAELRIKAAVWRGRAEVASGRVKTHEEAEQLLESWAGAWTSK